MEDHNDVDLEADAEVLVLASSTRVNFGEQHVSGNLNIVKAVTISHLDILDFGGLSLSLKCFHPH